MAEFERDAAAYRARFGLADYESPRRSAPKESTWGDPDKMARDVHMDKSPIHGHGVFASVPLSAGTVVSEIYAPSGEMTDTVGMMNASKNANVAIQQVGGSIVTVTTAAVEPGAELVGDMKVPSSGVWHGTSRD